MSSNKRVSGSNLSSLFYKIPDISGTTLVLYSESELMERYNLGLTERRWRGNVNGLSDLSLLGLAGLLSFVARLPDPSSFIPKSKEAAEFTNGRESALNTH